jgi:thiol-disulfide isomerase/thioredoxin
METFVKLFLNLLMIMTLTGCNNEKNATLHLSYKDSTFIEINADNVTDTLTINTRFCSLFPFRPCLRQNLEITSPGVYYMGYRLTKPELIKLDIGDPFQTILMPGDTLKINLDSNYNSKDKKKISYSISDKFYNYFKAKRDRFGYYTLLDARDNILKKYYAKISIAKESYYEAVNILSEAENQNLEFLLERKKDLPEWFFEFEKANIMYGSATVLFYLYRNLSPEDQSKIPFKEIPFVNSNAYLSTPYYYFVSNYLDFKFPRIDFNSPVVSWKIKQIKEGSSFIDSIFEGEIKEYFKTVSLADLYFYSDSRKALEIADAFIKENCQELKEDQKLFIDYDKKVAVKFLKIKDNLPAGDPAPRFYLKDPNGIAYQFKDFTGKVIYLHFWATWCAPCIKEIPTLNQLKSKLRNQPFELINICLDDNPDKWRQIIESEKLEGINLICKGTWDKSLNQQYFINELPHYVVIDQDAKIMMNHCPGPEAVYTEIVSAINKK